MLGRALRGYLCALDLCPTLTMRCDQPCKSDAGDQEEALKRGPKLNVFEMQDDRTNTLGALASLSGESPIRPNALPEIHCWPPVWGTLVGAISNRRRTMYKLCTAYI